MLDVPAIPDAPDDEPLFGACLEYLQDSADLLSPTEMARVVHAMRERQPREYQTSLGAGRVGDLPTSIK
eukprot:3455431-Rhodomonas_salina.1